MIAIGTVLTNSEEDEFKRVKVEALGFYEESELMPSVNSIYLSKGDRVIIDTTYGVDNAFILGKFRDKLQNENSQQGEGQIIYETKTDDGWSELRAVGNGVIWSNSEGVKLTIEGENITLECTSLSIQSEECTLKSDSVAIEANSTEIKGKVTIPNTASAAKATGPFCGVPNCLFSGAPHLTDSTQ